MEYSISRLGKELQELSSEQSSLAIHVAIYLYKKTTETMEQYKFHLKNGKPTVEGEWMQLFSHPDFHSLNLVFIEPNLSDSQIKRLRRHMRKFISLKFAQYEGKNYFIYCKKREP
jgi:uncharacterized protein YpmS